MRKGVGFFLCAAGVIPGAVGHYCFHRLIVNDTLTEPWQYVRNVTTGPSPLPNGPAFQENPQVDLTSDNMRCGRNGAVTGRGSEVATVVAGDTVGFRVFGQLGEDIYHPGPGLAYLSQPPRGVDVRDYDGSGEWFKIEEVTLDLDIIEEPGHEGDIKWLIQGHSEFKFRIPERTPTGEYLLRVEHIYPWSQFNKTQFFVNCAQINIVGPGGGKPGPTAKFPGAYANEDPGILISKGLFEYHIRNSPGLSAREYQAPGPRLWDGL